MTQQKCMLLNYPFPFPNRLHHELREAIASVCVGDDPHEMIDQLHPMAEEVQGFLSSLGPPSIVTRAQVPYRHGVLMNVLNQPGCCAEQFYVMSYQVTNEIVYNIRL